MTTTNLTSLAYVAEIVPGTVPTSPAFQELPITSIGLSEDIVAAVSEAIRGDRMKDDLVVVDANVGGDNGLELSYTPWMPMLVALLQQGGTPDADVDASLADITVAASGGTFTTAAGNFVTENIVAGQWLKIAGFTDAANNGIFRITTVTSTVLTIDATLHTDGLEDEASGDTITIKSVMYRNGTSIPDTFSFRKQVVVGVTPYYFVYPGVIVNSMTINLATASIITGMLNLVGRTGSGSASPLSGESTVEVGAYKLLNATSSVGAMYLSNLSTAVFNSLNLTMNNNVNPKKGIGTLGALGHGSFDFEVIGDCEIYFDDLTLYDAFKASTGFIVACTMTDGDGNSIVISMPNCKFLSLSEPIPGKNAFLMETGQIEALRDVTLDCNFQIDFMAA